MVDAGIEPHAVLTPFVQQFQNLKHVFGETSGGGQNPNQRVKPLFGYRRPNITNAGRRRRC